MFFTIKTNLILSKSSIKTSIMQNARMSILLHTIGANELALDKYIFKKYKLNLKLMCLKLLEDCNISVNDADEYIITFKHKNNDILASLITYGNGRFQGSDILKCAFNRN